MKALPRVVVHADGRIGVPDIFQYRLDDGTMLDVPPTTESHPANIRGRRVSRPYALVIYDPAKYNALQKSGWLYSPEHRGHHERFDGRKTS